MRHRSGFTLVELSIVLVIIGLLVGGVMVGKSLIRVAELRSAVTAIDKYKTAIMAFRLKYNNTPGDMECNDVIKFFPSAYCYPLSKKDGQISYSEGFVTWEVLGLAGLIEGSYNGRGYNNTGSGVNVLVLGYDLPSSAIYGVGYQIRTMPAATSFGSAATYMIIGGVNNNGGVSWLNQYFLSPKEAFSLDSKFDDGNPMSGVLRGYYVAACSTNGTAYAATDNIACLLGSVLLE